MPACSKLLAILRTCRQIRYEATPIFYAQAVFEVDWFSIGVYEPQTYGVGNFHRIESLSLDDDFASVLLEIVKSSHPPDRYEPSREKISKGCPSGLKHIYMGLEHTVGVRDCEEVEKLVRHMFGKQDIQVHIAKV